MPSAALRSHTRNHHIWCVIGGWKLATYHNNIWHHHDPATTTNTTTTTTAVMVGAHVYLFIIIGCVVVHSIVDK